MPFSVRNKFKTIADGLLTPVSTTSAIEGELRSCLKRMKLNLNIIPFRVFVDFAGFVFILFHTDRERKKESVKWRLGREAVALKRRGIAFKREYWKRKCQRDGITGKNGVELTIHYYIVLYCTVLNGAMPWCMC